MREYVNSAWVACVYRTLVSLGLNAGELFARFGLKEEDLSHPTAVMDAEKLRMMCKEVEKTHPDFGLNVGLHLHPMSFNSLSLEVLAQNSLRKALQSYSDNYHRICNLGEVVIEERNGKVEVSLVPNQDFENISIGLVDANLSTLLTLSRFVTASPIKPVELVHYNTAMKSRYEAFFDATMVSEGYKIALRFDAAEANKPLYSYIEGQGEELRRFISDSSPVSLGQKVKLIIAKGLGQKKVTLEYVAAQLFMSPRSLQRKLSEEELLFQDLLENVRRHRARVLFTNPDIPLIKVSSQLGFQSQNGLSRFTRAWMDMSPRELRRKWTPGRGGSAGMEHDSMSF
ncbi:AraC family transcriptional regulator ligand-binding domain-containing protein [Pokkaliibacter sp. CJK22405]|uniref:AraC family transcriptional regulator n=1 Tax=Pokkaliibacter sp. CJK22405 TaxID=3384615 RepID=UPI0039851CD3